MNREIEIENVRNRYQNLMDAWYEIEEILKEAFKKSDHLMSKGNDDDTFLLRSAMMHIFVSQIQISIQDRLRGMDEEIIRLETEVKMQKSVSQSVGK